MAADLPAVADAARRRQQLQGRLRAQVFEYKWSILYRALRSHVEWFDIATVSVVAALLVVAAITRRLDDGWVGRR